MNVLVSPVDALDFNYVSFGIFTVVNNLWTWVAVITAAVSFWRIRAAGAGTVKAMEPLQPSSVHIERELNTAPSLPETSSVPADSGTQKPAPLPVSSSLLVFEDNGATKGKFVVHYQLDDRENEGNIDGYADGELAVSGERGTCGGGDQLLWEWERTLGMRMGNFGWYKCQDLTVINGNVVRFWDGEVLL